jgi:hypothetical protein
VRFAARGCGVGHSPFSFSDLPEILRRNSQFLSIFRGGSFILRLKYRHAAATFELIEPSTCLPDGRGK